MSETATEMVNALNMGSPDADWRKYIDLVQRDPSAARASTGVDMVTAAHVAGRDGKAEYIKLLLARGADPSAVAYPELQMHVLHSIFEGEGDCPATFEIVEALLDAGADVDCCDVRGWSALAHASRCDFGEVARLLIRRGAVHAWDGGLYPFDKPDSVFGMALVHGSRNVLRVLLQEGCSEFRASIRQLVRERKREMRRRASGEHGEV